MDLHGSKDLMNLLIIEAQDYSEVDFTNTLKKNDTTLKYW